MVKPFETYNLNDTEIFTTEQFGEGRGTLT